jgi:fibronectin type 3 domain-containing protein
VRKRIISYSLVLIVLITTLLPGITVSGADENSSQPTQVVLEGGYLAKVIDYTDNGSPVYQVDFGAPVYCDDLITPIDTQWYEQKDGSFESGANKFDSSVSDEQIMITKDAETIKWAPQISLAGADNGKDLKLNVQNLKPEVLDVDPMNKNYARNTLVWHYDNGIDRYFRIIEGLCQEYYVINKPLENDLVIDPQATQTENFNYYRKATAYDAIETGIQLKEDDDKIITLNASSAKESKLKNKEDILKAQREATLQGKEPEVMYPIVIDPDYVFTTSASDGTVAVVGSNYNTVRTSTSAIYVDKYYSGLWVGQTNYYEIDRSTLYFNTSGLGSSATITSAILNLYLDSWGGNEIDLDVQIQNGQPTYPHDPLVAGDYNLTNYSGNGGSINSSEMRWAEYYPVNLSSTGLTWINKTGTTKFMLRTNRDINGDIPIGGEMLTFGAYEGGIGRWSELIVTYTGGSPPPPPSAPINVSASDGTYTGYVRLTWTASSGAVGYKIYRNTTNSSSTAAQIGTDSTSPYNDATAVAGTTYYYWLKAYNEGGNSGFSNSDTGWRAVAPPSKPTNVSASDGTYTDKVQITWTASSGATSYKIYRNTTNSSSSSTQIGTISTSPYDDTAATAGTTYYYWVKASNSAGDSSFSSYNTGWRAILNPPSAPTNVSASDGTYTDKVQITWTASSGATGYKIYRNTTNNSSTSTQIGTISASPYDDTTATEGTTYYYWVKAYNSGGDSGFSSSNAGFRARTVGGVSNYTYTDWPLLPDVPQTTTGFLDILMSNGWDRSYIYGNIMEQSKWIFTNNSDPSVDSVDLFWYAGHGAPGELILVDDDPWWTHHRVCWNEVEWGDNNLEWVLLLACDTLQNDPVSSTPISKSNGKFANSLNGAHMICGASNSMYADHPTDGENVAERLTGSNGMDLCTVKEAWFEGIDENYQESTLVNCRIIAEDVSYADEYIWGKGSGPASEATVDDYYVGWDWPCSNN